MKHNFKIGNNLPHGATPSSSGTNPRLFSRPAARQRLQTPCQWFFLIPALLLTACSKHKDPPVVTTPVVRFSEVVKAEQAHYEALQPLRQATEVRAWRLADQQALLTEFKSDPAAFVKRYQGCSRTYLFDAVVNGGEVMRIGCRGDGGKWVSDPQALSPGAVVYSFGVCDDISFDTEMAGRFGCEVHMFDPAPGVNSNFGGFAQGSACGTGRLFYHDLGIGPTTGDAKTCWDLTLDGKKCEVKDLATIARTLGHDRVDSLKLDIEGGEFVALTPALTQGVFEALGIRQLLVEVHLWDDDQFMSLVRFVGDMKQHGYEIFRKEFNPYSGQRRAEYAFLKTSP